jgi:hypothetical protein
MTTLDHSGARRIKLAFTRSEAAAALGVSPVTIDRLTRRKLLIPSRATRRPLYPLGELQRLLRETKTQRGPIRRRTISPAAAARASEQGEGDSTQTERNGMR